MRLTMVIPDLPIALNAALEGLVQVNVVLLLAAIAVGNPIPRLYELGIRYKVEPMPREWWQTIADNLSERKLDDQGTDCEDLAGHRGAELRVGGLLLYSRAHALPVPFSQAWIELGKMGLPYRACAVAKRTGRRTYHALVRHPDGHYEDPSRILGMRSPGDHKPSDAADGRRFPWRPSAST